jgi:hypothetical protein
MGELTETKTTVRMWNGSLMTEFEVFQAEMPAGEASAIAYAYNRLKEKAQSAPARTRQYPSLQR